MRQCDKSQLAADVNAGAGIPDLAKKYEISERALLRGLAEARNCGLIEDAAALRLRIRKEQHGFPDTSEARLSATLGCVNTEIKQAALLTAGMRPFTCVDMQKSVQALSPDIPAGSAFRDYCAQSFVPAGFVTKELFEDFSIAYYALSDAGIRYGQPVAAFSLRYGVDNGISIFELLGNANSQNGICAPYNRGRIVELVADGCDAVTELAQELNVRHNAILHHLRRLRKARVVSFETFNQETDKKTYEWTGKNPARVKPVWNCGILLTRNVAKWLQKNWKGDWRRISHELKQREERRVACVLAGLEKQGFARSRFPSVSRSRVALYEKAPLFLNYWNTVRGAVSGVPELDEMAAVLEEFRRDEKCFRRYLTAGIGAYSAVSPALNKKSSEEQDAEILESITRYAARTGAYPRPADIARETGLDCSPVSYHLNSMARKDILVKERTGKTVRYRPSEMGFC